MARYRAVNTRAEQAATQPFQAYSQDPSAFVAPLTATQKAGIENINKAAGMTQPYFQTAAGLTMAGSQGVGPLTAQQIQSYQNPFTQSVVDATRAGLQQQQGQQQAQQQAEAIRAGAFGGDRAGIQRATLMGQQGLATAQAISPLYQRAYEQAVQTATGQQGVRAQDLQRQLAAGQQLGGLGAQGQQAALAGAQAQLGAGTAEQQTQQAGLQALYNQFLQQRGYDFQTAQFLANIAMGTGALSGSTTQTTQPIPFFSDEREKTNVQPLGKGLYAYDYKDDVRRAEEEGRPMPPKRVGPMAQDIEERAPGLVGEVGGHKVVKGLNPESMGGAVLDLGPDQYRERFAAGGMPDFAGNLRQMYAQFGGEGGLAGAMSGGPYGAKISAMAPSQLKTAGAIPRAPQSMASEAMKTAEGVRDFGKTASDIYAGAEKGLGKLSSMTGSSGPSIDQTAITQGTPDDKPIGDPTDLIGASRARGGLVGYAGGGSVDKDDPMASYGAQRADIGIPTEAPDIKPLEGAKPPSTQPQSVAGDVAKLATAAAALFALSDARMKDNIEPVGELYDGQPVYRYNMKGSPKTQLGLMAQDLEHNGHGDAVAGLGGVKMVDYKRATDVAAGLAPRQGYQAGGTPSFDEALRRTLSYEGGYAEDTGGPTMMGISSRANPDVNLQRVKEDPEYRSSIYRERYWNPIGADRMDPRMANVAFDTAVNLGVGRTRQLLEEAGNDPARLLQLRQQHYNDLIARDPETYGRYGRGWSNRVNDLMAYAGGQGQAPASAAIEGAAGAPQGLGRAAQTAPAAQQPAAREGLSSMLPSRRDPRTGEETTDWKRIIIPALSGLGAMASSPSLFAGSAILQGLGAGAKSYADLEKQQADIGFREAETFKAAQEAANLSIFQIGNVTYVRRADGQPIPIWEWIRNRQPVLGGQFGMAAAEKAAERYMQGQGPEKLATAPGAPSPAAAAGTLPGTAAEPRQGSLEAPPSDQPRPLFGNRSMALADKEPEATLGPNPEVARKLSGDYANSTAAGGRAASEAAPTMNEMVLNVSKTVAGKGFDAPGTAYAARAQLAGVANTVARALGYQGPAFSEADTRQALQEKFNNVQGLAMASAGGQESLGALRAMVEALPRTDMPPDAQAQIAAQLLMLNQKAKDRDLHRVEYGQRSMQSFTAANSGFTADNPDTRYLQEMALLKSAIRNDPKAIDILTSGRATPQQVEQYFKELSRKTGVQYTPGISRYFAQAGG
jgi:lysozyme family protein